MGSVAGMLATQGLIVALTLPASVFLARSLGPATLGVFVIAQRSCALALVACHISVAHGFSYLSAEVRDETELRELVGAIPRLIALIVPVAALLAFASSYLQDDPEVRHVIFLLLLYTPCLLFAQFTSSLVRGQLKTRQFNLIRIAMPVTWFLLSCTLFLLGFRSLTAYVLAYVLSHLMSAVASLVVLLRLKWGYSYSTRVSRRLAHYGLRAHFGQAGREFNVYLDQVLLGFLLPSVQVGLYSVASSSATALSSVNSALLPISQPLVQRAAPHKQRRTAVLLMVGTGLSLGLLVAILIVPMPALVELVYGADYRAAGGAVRILLLAVLLDALTATATAVLFGLNRPGATSWASAVAIVVGIGSLLAFVPKLGIEGAAWASVLSYASGLAVNVGYLFVALWQRPLWRE